MPITREVSIRSTRDQLHLSDSLIKTGQQLVWCGRAPLQVWTTLLVTAGRNTDELLWRTVYRPQTQAGIMYEHSPTVYLQEN